MYCPNCGAKNKETADFCVSCGQKVTKKQPSAEKTPSLKTEPAKKSKNLKNIFGAILAIVILIIGGNFLYRTLKRAKNLPKRELLATYDKYPIWLLLDEKIAVYREMKVYTDTIEKQIVVKNLSDEKQSGVKISETIPKEIVQKASFVDFDPTPIITEEDPAVEWQIDIASKEQVNLSWKTKNLKYDVQKVLGAEAEETTFVNNFRHFWPTTSLKNPVDLWQEVHDFSKNEMQKSSKQAVAGKVITISKDITDILATMATGTGILDSLTVLSELNSIGTTLYGEETPEAIENANWWLTAGSLVKTGYDNWDILKATYKTGAEVIKAGKSLKAAATGNKLLEMANTVDPDAGVTAAEGLGLNIAGMIVDYAIINDVSSASKYFLFEANEQAKMEFASRNLVDWWQKNLSGNFTESDAKKIMEMEILFFIAQQKELGIRKAYFQSQLGLLDTVQYWLPVVSQYSAKNSLQDTEDNIITGQNQLRRRYSAREDIYKLTQNKESGLKALENAEMQALDTSAIKQNLAEKIDKIVEVGSELYKTIQEQIAKSTKQVQKSDKKTASPTTSATPQSVKKTELNYSIDNFPSTLLGFSKLRTNTALNPEDQCNSKISPLAFMEAFYGNNQKLIEGRVVRLESNDNAKAAPKILADCIEDISGITINLEDKGSLSSYPLLLTTADNEYGHIIDSAFVIVDQYLIGSSILTEDKTGAPESEYRQALNQLLNAFLKEGPESTEMPTATPQSQENSSTESSSGCQNIDLSNIEVYKADNVNEVKKACSNWEINRNALSFQGSCQMNAAYRIYGVKEVSTGAKNQVTIKADLSLEEPAGLFPGGGVHYDNYVDLMVFSKKPNELSSCNQSLDDNAWKSSCALYYQSAGFLNHCGVLKNSTSQKCDMSIDTGGKDKLYLIMAIHDAWAYAQVIGGFSNLQICY